MKIMLIASDIFFKGGIQRYTRYQYQALCDIYGSENIILYSLKKKGEVAFEDDIKVDFSEPYKGLLGKAHFSFKTFLNIKK